MARQKSTALDMIRSLAVIGIAVAFMFALSLQDRSDRSLPQVDVTATVEAARKNVDYPVLAVPTLPAKWRANAAYLEPVRGHDGRWVYHVGYVTPAEYYFGIDASNQPDIESFVSGYLYGMDTGETRDVAGLRFKVYEHEKQQVWLHRGVADVPYAIVLTGAGDPDDFATFTRMLTAG